MVNRLAAEFHNTAIVAQPERFTARTQKGKAKQFVERLPAHLRALATPAQKKQAAHLLANSRRDLPQFHLALQQYLAQRDGYARSPSFAEVLKIMASLLLVPPEHTSTFMAVEKLYLRGAQLGLGLDAREGYQRSLDGYDARAHFNLVCDNSHAVLSQLPSDGLTSLHTALSSGGDEVCLSLFRHHNPDLAHLASLTSNGYEAVASTSSTTAPRQPAPPLPTARRSFGAPANTIVKSKQPPKTPWEKLCAMALSDVALKAMRHKIPKTETEPPDELTCPITFELLIQPASLPSGKTYELNTLMHLVKDNTVKCPLTQKIYTCEQITFNHARKKEVDSWVALQTKKQKS